jgi:hypothetical protein
MKKYLILLFMCTKLGAQSIPDSLTNGLNLDVQYSKKYDLYVISPFANNVERDCTLFEYNLNTKFAKTKEFWINEQWVIVPQKNNMGTYYLAKQVK